MTFRDSTAAGAQVFLTAKQVVGKQLALVMPCSEGEICVWDEGSDVKFKQKCLAPLEGWRFVRLEDDLFEEEMRGESHAIAPMCANITDADLLRDLRVLEGVPSVPWILGCKNAVWHDGSAAWPLAGFGCLVRNFDSEGTSLMEAKTVISKGRLAGRRVGADNLSLHSAGSQWPCTSQRANTRNPQARACTPCRRRRRCSVKKSVKWELAVGLEQLILRRRHDRTKRGSGNQGHDWAVPSREVC